MSPFKVYLCCLVHECTFSEVLPANITKLVFQYVIDQIDMNNSQDCQSILEKNLGQLKEDLRFRLSASHRGNISAHEEKKEACGEGLEQ